MLAGDLAGFPNGRRLADDVLDIAVQAVEGAAITGELVAGLETIDSVDANDMEFGDTFPYLALPHSTSVNAGASAPDDTTDAAGTTEAASTETTVAAGADTTEAAGAATTEAGAATTAPAGTTAGPGTTAPAAGTTEADGVTLPPVVTTILGVVTTLLG